MVDLQPILIGRLTDLSHREAESAKPWMKDTASGPMLDFYFIIFYFKTLRSNWMEQMSNMSVLCLFIILCVYCEYIYLFQNIHRVADLDLDKMMIIFVSYISYCFCNVCDYNSVPLFSVVTLRLKVVMYYSGLFK